MLRKLNVLLLVLPFVLFSFGFVTLLSTNSGLVKAHIVSFALGYILFVVCSYFDYTVYKYIWVYIYVLCVALLAVTYFLAEQRFGSVRWLDFGFFTFQTSEFAKFALVLSIPVIAINRLGEINTFKTLFILGVTLALPVGFVLLQPDLGTSLVMLSVFVGVLFFAGLSKVYFFVCALIFGIFSAPIWHFLHDYQKNRILIFLNPQLDVLGSGYNVIQSMIAVGSGGLVGKGFGRGTQANLSFLPAHWTDFIFASFAEEWGFIGVMLLITAFLLLFLVILNTCLKSDDLFGKLICVGVFMVFFTQFTINIGMNLGIMPVTGITLPLVSYGGTSMIFSLALLGIVNNIWAKHMY